MLNSAAASFAIRMFSRLISSSLSPMPKSSRTICEALKVFVSTAVAAGREEPAVDLLDPLRAGVDQGVGQVHQRLAVGSVAPVRVGRVVAVQAGAHRAVEDDDALGGRG